LRCTGREIKARGWDALSENLSSLYGRLIGADD